MQLSVRAVIYFYIFICIVLLLFNLLYIARSNGVKRRQTKKVQRWEDDFSSMDGNSPRNTRKLLRRLENTEELTAFNAAMEKQEQEKPGSAAAFFRENHALILELAKEYGRRDAMERAFFAYVIAAFCPPMEERQTALPELLLGYLDNSTVFSRENVIHALCALGYIPCVEHAFILMSQQGWHHDPHLLSDGLNRFQGSKAALASRLWSCRGQLSECFQVGVIRFADSLDGDDFAEDFLRVLETQTLPTESCFALVRYFRRHAVPCAKPVLLRLLRTDANGGEELSIVAASSLASYPDEETRQALKEALHSQNWYVRQNAARSLKAMGLALEEMRACSGSDRYALDMLEYIFDAPAGGAGLEKETEVAAV